MLTWAGSGGVVIHDGPRSPHCSAQRKHCATPRGAEMPCMGAPHKARCEVCDAAMWAIGRRSRSVAPAFATSSPHFLGRSRTVSPYISGRASRSSASRRRIAPWRFRRWMHAVALSRRSAGLNSSGYSRAYDESGATRVRPASTNTQAPSNVTIPFVLMATSRPQPGEFRGRPVARSRSSIRSAETAALTSAAVIASRHRVRGRLGSRSGIRLRGHGRSEPSCSKVASRLSRVRDTLGTRVLGVFRRIPLYG